MNNVEIGPIRPPSEADAKQNKPGQDHTGLFCHAAAFHHRVSLKALVNEFQYLIGARGCHWNKCYFCGLYKSMQFSMRPIEETIEDIAKQAQLYKGKNFTSCFLQDGDALVLKTDYLLRILDALNRYFPNLQYITTYARADSITRKTLSELQALRQAGLNHLYCGMETGSDQILKLINKGFQADTVVESGCMAKDAWICKDRRNNICSNGIPV